MIGLTIRFADERAMMEWVSDMVGYQCLPAAAKTRLEDALDQPTARYVLDGGADGGREITEFPGSNPDCPTCGRGVNL